MVTMNIRTSLPVGRIFNATSFAHVRAEWKERMDCSLWHTFYKNKTILMRFLDVPMSRDILSISSCDT